MVLSSSACSRYRVPAPDFQVRIPDTVSAGSLVTPGPIEMRVHAPGDPWKSVLAVVVTDGNGARLENRIPEHVVLDDDGSGSTAGFYFASLRPSAVYTVRIYWQGRSSVPGCPAPVTTTIFMPFTTLGAVQPVVQ